MTNDERIKKELANRKAGQQIDADNEIPQSIILNKPFKEEEIKQEIKLENDEMRWVFRLLI